VFHENKVQMPASNLALQPFPNNTEEQGS
jgi:hypothetical protein